MVYLIFLNGYLGKSGNIVSVRGENKRKQAGFHSAAPPPSEVGKMIVQRFLESALRTQAQTCGWCLMTLAGPAFLGGGLILGRLVFSLLDLGVH